MDKRSIMDVKVGKEDSWMLHKKKLLILLITVALVYIFPVYHVIFVKGQSYYTEKEVSYLLFRGWITDYIQVSELIDKAEKAFCETDISEAEAKEKYGFWSRYCYTNESYEEVVKEKHNLRIWSVKLGTHTNEYDGYIWVCYNREGMNSDGKIVTGSKNVPVLWCLEQDEHGVWTLAEIKEMP